jgi:hypothetical protein
LLLASTVLLRAADDEEFVPLFNGKDLTGWVNVNCAPDTFTVRDGVIVSTGVPTGVMRTERMYENFVFEVEWRHLQPKGNAGIFVWSDAITAPGVPFTRSHEVQVLDGRDSETYTSHGDVFAIHGASLKPDRPHPAGAMRCLPSEKRCRPSPEWNHYRIECNDGVIKLAVNGKVVSGASECRPRKGYICLEAEGSECHFRNLKIHELPSTKAPSEETANADEGFRSLYTGVDLSGWKKGVPGKGRWQAKNWILGYDESNAVDEPLWTDKEYRDFTLICDWRITADHGDSGIYLRGSQKAQVNIWDDKIGSGIVYGYYGDDALPADVRAAATPKRKVDKPRGQWNRFLITLRGERLTVALNGETVIENARLPGLAETGPLALQPHDGKVEFANLYIKELDAEAK